MNLYPRIRRLKCLINDKKYQALVCLLAMSLPVTAQKIATLAVTLNHPAAGLEVPVHVMLDPITALHDSALSLVQLNGKDRIAVPFQVESNPQRKLTWIVNDATKNLKFELIKKPAARQPPTIKAEKKDGGLILKAGNKNLLRYQFETMLPPAGVKEVFKRSAFIHPLWAPRGQVLTRIQPPDHYHHYGIWNPWTHVLFEGDTVDFWNLNARTGTVRFANFISVVNGNIFGQYAALHEHVSISKSGEEKVAIREVQTVRVYAPASDADYYIADITVQMNCPGSPVRLLEYRYGGLGWRATEQWTKNNSQVLSSEGKSRKDADGSKARWCIVEGLVDGENAGAVMMSHPANFNHPEPLRIWPENANGNRGDMFANFSPTKDMDWPLEPGYNYVLRYRLIVFNGSFGKERAEAGWQDFALPPHVKVTLGKTPY